MDVSFLKDILVKSGLAENMASWLAGTIWLIILILASYVIYWITKKILLNTVVRFIQKTKTKKDDILLKHRIFERLSHIIPILFLYLVIPLFFKNYPGLLTILKKGLGLYLLTVTVLLTNSLLNAFHSFYLTLPVSRNRPIKGYVQVVQVLVFFSGLMFIISILFNVSVLSLFTGLGAMAAVIMLIFKDTILGFVASLQISGNDMLKPGDWIEMPGRGADGTVLEISLYTVKVQNWDKTIVTIPTYSLVSESFKNWRGMEESGGRRIKKSVYIDIKSIRFCTPEMIEKFRRIQVLQDYIDQKEKEIAEYNNTYNIDNSVLINGRRMTNIGTFRKYIEEYLKRHPMIHTGMTFMVRQLQSSEKGLPLEIYVFSKDQRWVNYEMIQADIFDHIFAAIPEFGLQIFQEPSGYDILQLSEKN
ncbi:MAG: mechanosensitive ion channel [Bacteroidales bacterium]|nr:mechanosensitive ion channel [Bacteroidales bacterium]